MDEYLSTDPNAGADGEYLSTDPFAGGSDPVGRGPVSMAGVAPMAGVAIPAGAAVAKRVVEEVATNPKIPTAGKRLMSAVPGGARGANVAKQTYDVMTGQQDPLTAVRDYAINEAGQQVAERAPGALQRLALKLAPKMAGAAGAAGRVAPIGGALGVLYDLYQRTGGFDPAIIAENVNRSVHAYDSDDYR